MFDMAKGKSSKREFSEDERDLIAAMKKKVAEETGESKSKLGKISLSTGITHEWSKEKKDTLKLTLSKEAIGLGDNPKNMQDNAAAFEGWALALHTRLGAEIVLDVEDGVLQKDETEKELENRLKGKSGHFARFLYRALRFSEQYSAWFSLSEKLEKIVDNFGAWMADQKDNLIGNAPKGEAGVNEHLEIHIEAAFAETQAGKDKLTELTKSEFIIDSDMIHRQLPVGLFLGELSEDAQIFTGGKAAIDLWGLSEDRRTLAIFELKAKNPMIGIVTELFFYANYMNDLINGAFKPDPKSAKKDRGYSKLVEAIETIQQVKAYMLADTLHPLITDKLLKQMNENGGLNIQYGKLRYDFEVKLK